MKNYASSCSIVAAVLLGAGVQAATFIIDQEPWNSSADGWQLSADPSGAPSGNAGGSLAWFSPGGNPGGYVQTTNNTSGNFNPQIVDRIFTTASPFAGGASYTTQGHNLLVGFDYNFSVVPSALQLFMGSSTSGTNWYYNISGLSAGGWASAEVPMYAGSAGWTDLGTELPASFLATLGDVDTIGFRLTYLTDTAAQSFSFDNFRRGYAVPEPGTYAALGFALSSLGFTFRRKLNESAARLKTLLKG